MWCKLLILLLKIWFGNSVSRPCYISFSRPDSSIFSAVSACVMEKGSHDLYAFWVSMGGGGGGAAQMSDACDLPKHWSCMRNDLNFVPNWGYRNWFLIWFRRFSPHPPPPTLKQRTWSRILRRNYIYITPRRSRPICEKSVVDSCLFVHNRVTFENSDMTFSLFIV